MKTLQSQLQKIQPQLHGSTISVENDKKTFTYSSDNITSDAQFYIGSLTKQFTAFIFLDLLHKKHPSTDITSCLNRKLTEEFPDASILKNLDKAWIAEISLLDLLTHRSGLSDYIEAYEHVLKQPELLSKPIDANIILQNIHFDTAKPYHYSNTNYFLLGKLIEEMTGVPFEQTFDQLIKTPAGMALSHAPTLGNFHALRKENRFQYLVADLNKKIFIDMANASATGNMISTSNDLLRWHHYFFNENNAKITAVMLKEYFKDEDGDSVNLGLTTSKTHFGPLIGFQGGQDSYHSFLGYLPNYQLSVVILSNNAEDFAALLGIFTDFLQSDLSKTKKTGNSLFFNTKTNGPDTTQFLNLSKVTLKN